MRASKEEGSRIRGISEGRNGPVAHLHGIRMYYGRDFCNWRVMCVNWCNVNLELGVSDATFNWLKCQGHSHRYYKLHRYLLLIHLYECANWSQIQTVNPPGFSFPPPPPPLPSSFWLSVLETDSLSCYVNISITRPKRKGRSGAVRPVLRRRRPRPFQPRKPHLHCTKLKVECFIHRLRESLVRSRNCLTECFTHILLASTLQSIPQQRFSVLWHFWICSEFENILYHMESLSCIT